MAIAGLATDQNRSMSYIVRNNTRNSDSDNGFPFMNQMLTFHRKESRMVQDEDGNVVNADRETGSELRFGSVQGCSPVGKYGELKPYTRCITANIKTREMTATGSDGEMIYSYQEEEECREANQYFSNLASSLFDAVNAFFDRTIWNSGISDEKLSLLFSDRDNIPDTVVSSKTQYTDPETGEVVPVSLRYTTSYSDDGISCRKDIRDGDKESSRVLWSLDFKDKEDLSKVRELLSGFDDEDRLTFATQKKFWESYLSGNIDVEGFKKYYDSTNNGVVDFERRMADGEKLSDIISEPYAEYFNNQSFVRNVYTEQEAMKNRKSTRERLPEQELTPLGIGFALAGNMGYGMSASLVSSNSSDDVIVRVSVAKGGGNSESFDVNLSEFDPKNATAVEMFAYCQYKDSIGEGSGHKWGSWNAVKAVISPTDGMNFGSLASIMNEKRDWTGALAKSKTYMENPKSGETLSAADLLKMFREQNTLTAEELKEGEDWRSMSEDDWDKLLSGVDHYIDAYKEEIRERVKKQMEAAQKAALEADPETRSAAAQEAALAVAASGFDGGNAE